MSVSKKHTLLIVGTGRGTQVFPETVYNEEYFVAPINWWLRHKCDLGKICLPDMTHATILATSVIGLARPADLGLRLFSADYFLPMILGSLTLSTYVRLKPELGEPQPLAVSDLAALLIDAVRKNPNHYVHSKSATDIERILSKAKTFDQIRRAFSYA